MGEERGRGGGPRDTKLSKVFYSRYESPYL